jgi:hypothetical protein
MAIKPINLAGVKANLDPIPAAEYELETVEFTLRSIGPDSKNAGEPMLGIRFQVVKDFHPEYGGRTVFDNIPVIAPDEDANPPVRGTYWRLRLLGEALQLTDDELENLNLEEMNKYKGRRIRAKVAIENDNNGEPRNKIKNYKPSTGLAPGISVPTAGRRR